MNCDDAKYYVGLDAADPRAAEMRAHLRACALCRAAVDHQNNVRATIALLRYEHAPEGHSARCVSKLMRTLREQPAPLPEPAAVAWWHAWRAWRENAGHLFQPLRLAAAAVLVVGIGVLYLTHTPTGAPTANIASGTPPALWSHINIAAPTNLAAPAPAIAPAPVPGAVENLPVMLASSNNGPMRMDYGPGGSVPVKFEY